MKAAQDIILTPVITERSVDDMAESKYTFKVAKDANKVEIANTERIPSEGFPPLGERL